MTSTIAPPSPPAAAAQPRADLLRTIAEGTAAEEAAPDWRAAQERFYEECREEIAVILDEPGWRLTEDEPMVVLSFRVIADR